MLCFYHKFHYIQTKLLYGFIAFFTLAFQYTKHLSSPHTNNMSIDRSIQPSIHLPESLSIPHIDHHTLPTNGFNLYSLHVDTQHVIRISLVVKAGTVRQSKPFVASSLLNMLSEGTSHYTSSQIATHLDTYGIYYDTSIDRDYGIITISCLEKFLDQSLEILAEVLLTPTFDAQELATYCIKRKEQLKLEREKPGYIARELFSEALFGKEHPYGKVSKEDNYDNLTADDLRQFFNSHYVSGNMFGVISGYISPESLQKIKTCLGLIPSKRDDSVTPISNDPITLAQDNGGYYHYEPRNSALQSSIRIGKRLFPKTHPDFNGMQVVAMILGGYFSSRLVNNLREERGYTYGVYSAMMNLEYDGYIAIATDVDASATEDSCTQIFYEIERLRTELVPADELDMVRNIISGEIMRILDGPFGIADITIEGLQIGCYDNSYLQSFIDEVKSISAERIQQLAQKYLSPSEFTTIIVGPSDND